MKTQSLLFPHPFIHFLSVSPQEFFSIALLIPNNKNVKNMDYVIIFSKQNYDGLSKQLSKGTYNINVSSIGFDKVLSLKVPVGLMATLSDTHTSQLKVFTENTGSVGDSFLASSLTVVPKQEPGSSSATEPTPTSTFQPDTVVTVVPPSQPSGAITISQTNPTSTSPETPILPPTSPYESQSKPKPSTKK